MRTAVSLHATYYWGGLLLLVSWAADVWHAVDRNSTRSGSTILIAGCVRDNWVDALIVVRSCWRV
jgi:hypothetical protein